MGPTTHVITSSHGQNLLAFPSVSSLYFSFCLDPAGLCLFLLAGTRASPGERAGGVVAAARSPSARRRQGLPLLCPSSGARGGWRRRRRYGASPGARRRQGWGRRRRGSSWRTRAASARALASGGELRRVVFLFGCTFFVSSI